MSSNPSTPDTDGPKTETTLTTRIRINIPGSRPIPPVVVRKPVKDGSAEPAPGSAESVPAPAPRGQAQPPVRAALPERPTGQTPASAAAPQAPAPAPQAPAEAPSGGGWFAPRKAAAPPPAAPAPAAAYGSSAPRPGNGAGGPMGGGFDAGPAGAPGHAPYEGAGTGAGFAPPAAPGLPQRPAPAPGTGAGAGFAPAPAVGGPGAGSAPGYPAYDGGPSTEAFPAFTEPSGPTGGPALGTVPVGADETPRWPGPEALDTPAPGAPRPGPAAPPPGPQPPRSMPAPAPAGKSGKAAPAGKPAKKKGRSKLVLLGGAVLGLAAVAYGAGLLMNHSDIPKGTKVLGVDISGSRDDAVDKLQTAFGKRSATPLQVTVGGKTVELKPEKAGLTLDSQTTVRNATGSDYNPVTVIGSLFGVERTAAAVMPVDEEKLKDSLQELAGTAGTATEGTITFDTGKPVAVPGKAGTSLDVDGSMDKVTKAFRELVANGKAAPVELPTATKEPTITQAELNRAMKEFAEPAMSAPVTVKAGTKSLAFGAKSLPKILSMAPVQGKLVEKYDLEALKATYGNAFEGVLITRGTGAKTPVTPQDVVGALGKGLLGKTPAERVVTIDTNAN
ncbi:hypothetical protein BX286_4769 [Streptomyces sp. 3211.6]|uniref:hypothetical protein n=1 Tax=Streptomyces sp. 3211.6 TaxID=1938845 RepID=UPI000EB486F2|nr:hypothetical protein [Streptomyces sp. 3211.6]RKT06724.1 hypothetical protein BX286_4769 [Streptomyces sp. 3211.6]